MTLSFKRFSMYTKINCALCTTNLTEADSSLEQWYIAQSIRGSHFSLSYVIVPLKRMRCTLCVSFFYFGEMTTVTAERQKAVHVRLEILFITRTGRYSSSFSLHQLTFFRHPPPLLSHGWKAQKNPGNLLFFSPLLFPCFHERKRYSRTGRKIIETVDFLMSWHHQSSCLFFPLFGLNGLECITK